MVELPTPVTILLFLVIEYLCKGMSVLILDFRLLKGASFLTWRTSDKRLSIPDAIDSPIGLACSHTKIPQGQ